MLAPPAPNLAPTPYSLNQATSPTASAGEFEGLLARQLLEGETEGEGTEEPAAPEPRAAEAAIGLVIAAPLPVPPASLPSGEAAALTEENGAASNPSLPLAQGAQGAAAGEPAPAVASPPAAAPPQTLASPPSANGRPDPKEEPTPEPGDSDAASAQPAEDQPAGRSPQPAPARAPGADPAFQPPPLRALAERTSQPIDAAAGRSEDDASRARDSDGVEPASSPRSEAATAAPDRSAPPPAPRPAAEASPTAPPVEETPRGQGQAGGDRTTAFEPTTAATPGAAGSILSRAAIETTAQIAAQILRRLDGRATRFEMALLPEELGRVDVRLDIDSEGRLAARLAFDNPAAAADLRGRADELRRQLEQAGFQLAEDAFDFAERDSGSSAFDRGEDARQGSQRAFAAARRLNLETAAAPVLGGAGLSLSPAGVDLKV